MPKIVKADLWEPANMHVVTTNGVINARGRLVMGAGAAKQALDRHFALDDKAGTMILANHKGLFGSAYLYGFLPVVYNKKNQTGVGIFQTKWHWEDAADTMLIRLSSEALAQFAALHPNWTIRMNYPGIGLGGLPKSVVEEHIRKLPDNVTVCWRD